MANLHSMLRGLLSLNKTFLRRRHTNRIRIDMSRNKLPRRNLLSEQNIQFGISATLRLWETEKRPCEGDQSGGAPEKSSLAGGIPCGRIHEIWFQDLGNDIGDLVGCAC